MHAFHGFCNHDYRIANCNLGVFNAAVFPKSDISAESGAENFLYEGYYTNSITND